MFHRIRPNLSPRGETFKGFDRLEAVFGLRNSQKVKSTHGQGERFGERFKSHKYMKNNIYIKIYINLSPIHPPHAYATRYVRTRVEVG